MTNTYVYNNPNIPSIYKNTRSKSSSPTSVITDWNIKTKKWNDKSQNAILRENKAKFIFTNQFLPAMKQSTSFPFIMKDIIPPEVHLTNKCFRDFRKLVIAHGCVVKRREITYEEKMRLKVGDRHKVKMYSITLISPERPPDKKVNEAGKDRRMDKQEEAMKQKSDLDALVVKEYAMIESLLLSRQGEVQDIMSKKTNDDISDKKRPLRDITNKSTIRQKDDDTQQPLKKLKVVITNTKATNPLSTTTSTATSAATSPVNNTNLHITVPIEKLLNQAAFNYHKKVYEIQTNFAKNKAELRMNCMDEVDIQRMVEVEIDKVFQHYLSMKKIIHEVVDVVNASSLSPLSSCSMIEEYGGGRVVVDDDDNAPLPILDTARASWIYNTNDPVPQY